MTATTVRPSPMSNDLQAYLTVRVEPAQMVQYVHDLMTTPTRADARWGGDSPTARAAKLRWNALNRAFNDVRVSTWTTPRRRDQLHVPAALIAAAGVARLEVTEDEIVFDIPTLLDATLELCEAVGHA